ncbi:MAG: serine/threonine protein kinase [Phycisphaerales bacterium]|nr:serine/threonine protein kinase [Phycisphaerales bacterium]
MSKQSNDNSSNSAGQDIQLTDENASVESTSSDDTTPFGAESIGNDPMTVADAEKSIMDATKDGTNLDTLIGRLVIDQGLATPEEVKHCLTLTRTEEEQETLSNSLAQVLVNKEYVTKRQIARLREAIQAERSGSAISGYRILGKLGAGAMATVYKAKQVSLDRMVAIKKLPKKFSQNPQFIERFFAEGRAAASLNHPNIVQAFDVGNEGDMYYFVMEYVEGRSVHEDIVTHKRFKESDAIDVGIQVAEALEHAHERGLIHRDVKPKNIMITKEGVVKLADMGLARAISDVEAAEAEAGRAFGTPYYISPEQIRGEKDIGPPADIYSLGVTLYHMVTGNVPFEGKNPSSVMHKHLKNDLIPPDHVNPKLGAGISEVIEMMMAKRVKNRYQNCSDLLIDLRAIKKGESPPLAHKDVFHGDDLADIAAQVQAEVSQIPEHTATGSGGFMDHIVWPPFLVVVALLLISVLLNIL